MVNNFVEIRFAKRLKALGFNEKCIAWYDLNDILTISSYDLKESYEN